MSLRKDGVVDPLRQISIEKMAILQRLVRLAESLGRKTYMGFQEQYPVFTILNDLIKNSSRIPR